MNNRFSQKTVVLSAGSMDETAMKIRNMTEEIKTALDSIKSEINAISNVWQDKNAEVFIEKFQDLQKDFPAFYGHAYGFSNFLTGVVKAYREQVLEPTNRAVQGRSSNS